MAGAQADGKATSPLFYWIGLAGLTGCVVAVASHIVGVLAVDRIGFVNDTISDLAAGEKAWIQDLGLYLFWAGVLAQAVALYMWRLDGLRFQIGALTLGLMAVTVLGLGAWNEYGDEDNVQYGIHMGLVYVLGVLFALVTLLTSRGFHRLRSGWKRFSLIMAALWIGSGPIYFVVPDPYEGLYERIVILLMVLWVSIVSRLVMRRGEGEFASISPIRHAPEPVGSLSEDTGRVS